VGYRALLGIGNKSIYLMLRLLRKNLMLSDVEKGNNLMLTRLTTVATLFVTFLKVEVQHTQID